MSFFQKLFQKKQTKIPNTEPAEPGVSECPKCHSQKVTLQFAKSPSEVSVPLQEKDSGGCHILESGTMKKVCQMCGCVWDEQEFDTPAFFMMKPKGE